MQQRLPASPSSLLDRQDRAITSARPRSVSRHVGRTRRRNHDGRATRTGGLVKADRIVGGIRRHPSESAVDRLDQRDANRRVVDARLRQGPGDDHTRSVDTEMPRLPASPPPSVSNPLSGRHWELDQVPAVGDPTDIVQLGTGHHVAAGEGRRRVALQRRVAAYLVVGGQTPGATQRCLNPGFSERIGNSRRTGPAGRHLAPGRAARPRSRRRGARSRWQPAPARRARQWRS